MKLRTPPYGKGLKELQKQGLKPRNSVYLFTGKDAFQKGNDFFVSMPERLLVLPPWLHPDEFLWPVTGCDILIFDTGWAETAYVDSLACALYRDGAEKVRFSSADHKLTVYHKDMQS